MLLGRLINVEFLTANLDLHKKPPKKCVAMGALFPSSLNYMTDKKDEQLFRHNELW
jgi:hypothetical protein